jgi:hypothetical protein
VRRSMIDGGRAVAPVPEIARVWRPAGKRNGVRGSGLYHQGHSCFAPHATSPPRLACARGPLGHRTTRLTPSRNKYTHSSRNRTSRNARPAGPAPAPISTPMAWHLHSTWAGRAFCCSNMPRIR